MYKRVFAVWFVLVFSLIITIRGSAQEDDSRNIRLATLDRIGEALKRGNTGEGILSTLEYLAFEGTFNRTGENGDLLNSYPDIRTKAVNYLGDMGTPEAKNILIKIFLYDSEAMVVTEAIKSLIKLGINDNDETVNAIAYVVTKFTVLNPDNILAMSAMDAFEKFTLINNGIVNLSAMGSLRAISNNKNYVWPLRERADKIILAVLSQKSQLSTSTTPR